MTWGTQAGGWLDRLIERKALERLSDWGVGSLRVWLGQGDVVEIGSGEPRAEIRVHDPRTWRRFLLAGETGIGEAYMAGEWSTPDLAGLITAGIRNRLHVDLDGRNLLRAPLVLLDRLRHRSRENTRQGSERNIHAHYDLGNDFFRLFLDDTLAYSAGIFRSTAVSLEEAQREKYRVICEKLALGPEDHLLEIGTGWAGLALHAVRETGCRVTTITISREQHAYAREAVARAGLADRIDVQYRDYRDVEGSFDKIVSIEMLEAVGQRYWNTFFGKVSTNLKRGGRALIQVICVPDSHFSAYARSTDWLQKYIFPGGCLPSLFELQKTVRGVSALELAHVEDIGLHYATTLALWRERFFKNLDAVRALGFDDVFVRLWEFYLASCEGSFTARNTLDYQLLYRSPESV